MARWLNVLLLAAVSAAPPRQGPAELGEGEWRLVELAGVAPLAGSAWIAFAEKGELHGHAGCNRFHGTFTAADGKIEIRPPLAMTRMACPGEALARQEGAFVAALQAARGYALRASRLELRGADASLLMAFERAPR